MALISEMKKLEGGVIIKADDKGMIVHGKDARRFFVGAEAAMGEVRIGADLYVFEVEEGEMVYA